MYVCFKDMFDEVNMSILFFLTPRKLTFSFVANKRVS